MFRGSIVALITPFKEDKSIDEEGLRKNIRFLIEHNSSGLLACGTTGESPALTDEEKEKVIKITVEETKGKIPVIAGTGTNNTEKTIKTTQKAKEIGADAALVITPYYNKPTQEGLYKHFVEVAKSVDIPLIIYNVPGRTGVNISPETIEKIVKECKNVVAVKEASGNLDQTTEIIARLGDRIVVLSGDDSKTLPILSAGGKGVISVIANIIPADVEQMIRFFEQGKMEEAKRLHLKMYFLTKALFIETNPAPIKEAMNLLGMPAGPLRLPLVSVSERSREIIKRELKNYGLL